jgi:hypothetical protein
VKHAGGRVSRFEAVAHWIVHGNSLWDSMREGAVAVDLRDGSQVNPVRVGAGRTKTNMLHELGTRWEFSGGADGRSPEPNFRMGSHGYFSATRIRCAVVGGIRVERVAPFGVRACFWEERVAGPLN